jgi:mono/diheme cytochrome c family protein
MRSLAVIVLFGMTAIAAAESPDPVRANYLFGCRGCHLADGRGVPPEVPTLRDNLGTIMARPGGRDYLVRVPGVLQSRLDDAELAAVLNYVLTEFNAATLPAGFRPYTAREVAAARKAILADPHKYRRELFAGESAPE